MPGQASVVLEGSFDAFSLDEVLDVVSISRQCMEVVLDDEGSGGRMLVRSGQVLAARTGGDVQGRDAFVSLYQRPGRSFVVYRREPRPHRSIGTLSELIELARTAPAAPEQAPVLEGRFAEHTIEEVLQVVGMSRQTLKLSVLRAGGARASLVVKAGRVLACTDPGFDDPQDAFRALVADPGERFVVSRALDREQAALGTLATWFASLGDQTPVTAERRQVLLEGRFDDFGFVDVLTTLSISRQVVELILRGSGGTRGTLVLKSGQLLAAHTVGSGARGREAFHELLEAPGEAFVALRRAGARVPDVPVAPLAELLDGGERVLTPVTPTRERLKVVGALEPAAADLVLEGRFDTFTFQEVMDVASLSRQCLEVRIAASGKLRARMLVKAGRLLGARHVDGSDPVRVLAQLLAEPGDAFRVRRVPAPDPLPRGIPLVAAMDDARELSVEALATAIYPAPVALRDEPTLPSEPDAPQDVAVDTGDVLHAIRSLESTLETASLEGDLRAALDVLTALERRVAQQDELLASLSTVAAPRDDRWLVGALLAVQVGTLLLVAVFLLTLV